MTAVLHVLRREWFDTSDDIDVAESWNAKNALRAFAERIRADEGGAEAEKEYQRFVAQRARELLFGGGVGDDEAEILA